MYCDAVLLDPNSPTIAHRTAIEGRPVHIDELRAVAARGYPEKYETMARLGFSPTIPFRLILSGEPFVHVPDITTRPVAPSEADDPMHRAAIEIAGIRTALFVPLRKDTTVLGYISAQRQEKRLFTDKEIALLENFAAQAVIAMENARVLNEQREALERQTAMAEVLEIINSSPGDLTRVFDAMLSRARGLCQADGGVFWIKEGGMVRVGAQSGFSVAGQKFLDARFVPGPDTGIARLAAGAEMIEAADLAAGPGYETGDPLHRVAVDVEGFHGLVAVPLRKDTVFLGAFGMLRKAVGRFTDKQISLLRDFAVQAVIAMENARLLETVRQRQAELHITFENMGDGVALFDETPRLVAWNRRFQEMLDMPDGMLAARLTFAEYICYLAERGEYGEADPATQIQRLTENIDQFRAFERVRPDGRVIEVRHNPVPDGGFVLIYADITERKQNEAQLRAARDAAEEASRTVEAAYRDLKAAQANLIQAEKMASLGQLTAGIAHEIKNPLNFVNNFSELSVDLLDELQDAVTLHKQDEVEELRVTLKGRAVQRSQLNCHEAKALNPARAAA